MAHITELSSTELLNIYSKNKDEAELITNTVIPNLFWNEQCCRWRGDYKSALKFERTRESFVDDLRYPQKLMQFAREELVRRKPAIWSYLEADIKPDLEKYKRPDLALMRRTYRG
jgi:hypothetical protein